MNEIRSDIQGILHHVIQVTSTRYRINSPVGIRSLQEQVSNGWCGETVFSSEHNADCSSVMLVSRNWQGLTTSEPASRQSGIKWRQQGIWFHHCHLPSRSKPPNIRTFDQRLIKAPEEVADCGWSGALVDFPDADKMQKKWKHASDVTLCCRARANDLSVLHIQIFNVCPCQPCALWYNYLHSYLTNPTVVGGTIMHQISNVCVSKIVQNTKQYVFKSYLD